MQSDEGRKHYYYIFQRLFFHDFGYKAYRVYPICFALALTKNEPVLFLRPTDLGKRPIPRRNKLFDKVPKLACSKVAARTVDKKFSILKTFRFLFPANVASWLHGAVSLLHLPFIWPTISAMLTVITYNSTLAEFTRTFTHSCSPAAEVNISLALLCYPGYLTSVIRSSPDQTEMPTEPWEERCSLLCRRRPSIDPSPHPPHTQTHIHIAVLALFTSAERVQ